jgi:hypothetical protein
MYLTRELFLTSVRLYSTIQQRVVDYCYEMKLEHIPSAEDVRISEWGNIEYSWRVNTSCHCHPEMVVKTHSIKFEDFLAWAEIGDAEI